MVRQAGVWLVRVAFTIVLLGLLWVMGQVPSGSPAQDSVLRLAWRMSGAQVRLCHDRSEAELLELAPHMRQAQSCEDYAVPYRLSLRVGGATILEREVLPRGAKGDRPIYVQEDLRLSQGSHDIQLIFAPVIPARENDREEDDTRDGDERDERHEADELRETLREHIEATPRYEYAGTLRTELGRITMIELDEGSRTWNVHEPK